MLLSLNVLFLGLSLVVIDAAPVKLDEAVSKLIETNYNQGFRSGANNRSSGRAKRESFPSYNGINKIQIALHDYESRLFNPHFHNHSPFSPPPPRPSNDSLESEESTEVEESDRREQVGTGAISKRSYTYTNPDGVILTVNWVADENGFQATGDHLPNAPPMPEHVVKLLADLKAAHLL
uniref:Uncharacterized protein n=1 Tax=Daphnia galeata TaxID=27404 RepID=A0A8J2RUN6_9CRUS|nr:unnamed protein product [Daphnia galeata]